MESMDSGKSGAAFQEEIERTARAERDSILDAARASASRKRRDAEHQIAELRNRRLQRARNEAERVTRRTLARIDLDIRRSRLRAREELVAEVLEGVRRKLAELRNHPEYGYLLCELAVEGVLGLGETEVVLEVAPADIESLREAHVEQIRRTVAGTIGKEVALTVAPNPEVKLGVIVRAGSGRAFYDNTFGARERRFREPLRKLIIERLARKEGR